MLVLLALATTTAASGSDTASDTPWGFLIFLAICVIGLLIYLGYKAYIVLGATFLASRGAFRYLRKRRSDKRRADHGFQTPDSSRGPFL